MFIAELNIYLTYFEEQLEEAVSVVPDARGIKYLNEFYQNLLSGIAYYRTISEKFPTQHQQFQADLDDAEARLRLTAVNIPECKVQNELPV